MEAVISTSAGVLIALMRGPGYGRDLIRLLDAQARGMVNPRPGTVYRAFESLVRKGYVRSWVVVPGGRRGARARRYYELTPEGVAVAQTQRQALAHLLGLSAQAPPTGQAQQMGRNIRRAAEVSAFALKLLSGVRQAARRRV